MPVCDGVLSLQWFLVPSLDSCSLESCRLQSCCPETRHVLCEQHGSAHSCQNHSLGACGTTVEMRGSQLCREIIPGCSSGLVDVGLIFFLVVVKLPSVYALSQSCLPVLLVSCSSWSPTPAPRLVSRGVYLCPVSCSPGRVVPEQ